MTKIMKQLDILYKNFMGARTQSVNVVGIRCTNPEVYKFEALYKIR